MSVEDRKLEVLRAIVEDFIATNEPVGSKALADRHNLGVSPATIRNDMASLEEEGLIAQPHTSAGRIPTDAGYRLFVDQLTEIKPLSVAEKRAIQAFLDHAVDLDDVLRRAVRTLAQLTHNVAVVQYPSLSRSKVRHLELVSLSASRLMLVLITDTGRVEQRVVELPAPVGDEAVADLRTMLNARLRDRPLAEAPEAITELPVQVAPELRGLLSTLTSVLLETLFEQGSDRIVLGGTANLTEHTLDFPAIRPVLEALEEQVVLLRLLDRSGATSQIVVRIGNENNHEGLMATSVVTSGYGARGAPLGAVGVLGPRRMDYAHTMARVAAVAGYVGDLLGER
ncbi:MAG: heat-inducible transcriptional repressor [Pseudonocardiales bacterium]|jgi:heat-inducible transcriptional repressor|nr:heat-inducible transcription repressor HrcA [Pseudonocardiales bacterium]MDT4907314.1 heat-inducible transcriptional repressor [Pseudonocardiales bacterium]MDT4964121.1 heat-inducible transcriptional repressor [Pseudonocardiales bacterium]MDT4970102.1 heat-inducible transcriptional repressor [Pseudonocardiales bacterium]